MKVAAAAVAICAAAFAAAGCGERPEPVATAPSLYPVRIEGGGGQQTVLQRRPTRVLPLSIGARRVLEDVGAAQQLVGPQLASAPFWKLEGPELVREIVRLRPDLIVATAETSQGALHRAVRQTHAPVYLLPDAAIDRIQQAVIDLGLLTDHPVEARAVVRDNRDAVALVRRRLARAPRLRVFIDTGFFTTIGRRTLIGDVLRAAHGIDVAENPGPEPFDLRRLAKLDPQVYIATTDSGTTLAYLRKYRKTRRLTAVREGRFVLVPPTLLEDDGRLREKLFAVARLLHPDAFR